MRSILREKSQDFFSILQYDRSQWLSFWEKYRKENKEIMSGYISALELTTERIETILATTRRPFLDKIKQKNDNLKHLKQKAAKTLNRCSEELSLSKEDFVIYLIGALGIKDVVVFNSGDRLIVLIDIVSLYQNNKIEQLQEIVFTAAKEARKALNQNK